MNITATEIECEMCKSPAYSHVQWGQDEKQAANLCRKHVAEVWETVQPQIATGLCFWIQGEPQIKPLAEVVES